ncbi:hypothetical protein I3843_08G138300 [Carya illinoinensis]|nr:hypothetical protein I3843_08G138300 [Carya illinoinensis]
MDKTTCREYIGTGNFEGSSGNGASELRTLITCFIEGRIMGSGWQHHSPTTIKRPIRCSSNSILNPLFHTHSTSLNLLCSSLGSTGFLPHAISRQTTPKL